MSNFNPRSRFIKRDKDPMKETREMQSQSPTDMLTEIMRLRMIVADAKEMAKLYEKISPEIFHAAEFLEKHFGKDK